jgi:hypothetical protein
LWKFYQSCSWTFRFLLFVCFSSITKHVVAPYLSGLLPNKLD